MTKNANEKLRRIPSWYKVQKVLEVVGWQLVDDKLTRKVFVRGNEKIVSLKTVGDMWKSEYFYRNKLKDTTGVFEREFIQLLTMEMGVLK